MHIQHSNDKAGGRFFIETDNRSMAELTYTKTGTDRLSIDHTEVDKSLQGQGVGKELVHSAVEYARQEGLKIVPLCSYAKVVFENEPDLKDVL